MILNSYITSAVVAYAAHHGSDVTCVDFLRDFIGIYQAEIHGENWEIMELLRHEGIIFAFWKNRAQVAPSPIRR